MTMRFSQFKTHWTPEQALEVIEFLDQLRDTLWESYGEAICQEYSTDPSSPIDPDLDDELTF